MNHRPLLQHTIPAVTCVLAAALTQASARPAPLAAFSALRPAAVTGSCGSVLLAGGNWLGGQGVDVMSNGVD